MCMVDTCAWWIHVHGGYMCMVDTCAWWIHVHGGYMCMVDTCAWWIHVHGGYMCMVDRVHGGDMCMVSSAYICTVSYTTHSEQAGLALLSWYSVCVCVCVCMCARVCAHTPCLSVSQLYIIPVCL